MGSGFVRIMLFTFCAFWVLPELVFAKHTGTTRHYKFDVRTASHAHHVKHLSASPLASEITF